MRNSAFPNSLITHEFILKQLPTVLVDSIVLDEKFNIVMVSQNILDRVEFSAEELRSKNINYLTAGHDLASVLQASIEKGFFDEQVATFHTKNHRALRVELSGFYFEVIQDVNCNILMKIKALDEVETDQKLQRKSSELDKFIYRTAHDLRGPLATMKGLINLMKIREDNFELERFILLLETHANRLDERLFQLVYVAQSGNAKAIPNSVDFEGIETSLRQIIERNAFVDFLEFHYAASCPKIAQIDDSQLSMLLSNILLYLLALPMSSVQVQVFFRLTVEEEVLKITIASQGFETSAPLRDAIRQTESLYTNIIFFPQLLNFYAAQKIAWQLKSAVNVQFLGTDKQRITIDIPFG